MMTPRDKTPLEPPAAPLIPGDDWDSWKPDWRKRARGPHALQERHSPTQNVALHVTNARSKDAHRRRIVDARLWDAMSQAQQSAALEIARAFEMMGKGLGYATSNWERIPGCKGAHNAVEMHGRFISAYVDWTKRCHKEGVSHSMIIDILVYGFSCRALDRDRRVKAGEARKNLMEGLSVYCEMKGWPRD